MNFSICSYSFHRALAAGRQDIFQYIKDCQSLGCSALDPWMAHLAPIQAACAAWRTRENPLAAEAFLSSDEIRYLTEVRRAAELANLPVESLAVDGGHVIGNDEAETAANRAVAYRWLDAAAVLGAKFVRLDCGLRNQSDFSDADLATLKTGYADLLSRAQPRGIQVVIENHMGPSKYAEPLKKLLTHIPTLGLLWDSHNWAPGERNKGRESLASRASITHIKALQFDETGNDPTEDLPHAIACLKNASYRGTWGIESTPTTLDEHEAAHKLLTYLREHAT